jgi:diguanylate cyclase (GGDEF)-like protein/PAS domain S-box-containing protein
MAVVAAVVSVWTHVRIYLPDSPFRQSLVFGAVMGIGSVLTMSTNFEAQPGLYFDLRSVLPSVAGFFGGPIAGLLAAAIGIAYRLAVGGVGATAAVAALAFASAIGIVGSRWVAGRQMRERDIVVLAAATAASLLIGLALLPQAARNVAVPFIVGPGMGVVFSGTRLAGLALLHDVRLRAAMETNMVYRETVDLLPDCLNFKDRQGRFVVVNSATARLMRAKSVQDLIGKTDFDFYPEVVARRFQADEEAVLVAGAPKTIEQKVCFPDGAVAWLSTLKAPTRDDQGRLVGLISLNRDVTEQKRLQNALQLAHEHLEDALANMADGLVLYNRDGVIQYSNPQYRRLFPLTADLRIAGANLTDVIRRSIELGEEALPETDDFEAWLVQRCREILQAGDRTIHLSGDRWIEARTRTVRDGGWLILFTDTTDRKRAQDALTQANERLASLALSDGLTGLTNRRGFDQTLDREFARSARDGNCLGLLLVDVDNFKRYNDGYGHQSGDRCLQLIGAELQSILRRPGDLAARYGGEEFVAILPNTSAAGAVEIAEALRRAVKALGLSHKSSEYGVVTVSVGVAAHVPGRDVKRPEDLLRKADEALYAAKAGGRDRVYLDVTATSNRMASSKLVQAS